LQAGLIALGVSYRLRHVPGSAATLWWPYFLFAYAFMAVIVPWLAGCFVSGEFRLPTSAIYGVVLALPVWTASRWLKPTPYQVLYHGCRIMVVLWCVHLIVALVRRGTAEN